MYRGDIASRVGLDTVLFGHTPAGIGGWTISGWRNGSAFVVIGGVWFIDVSGNLTMVVRARGVGLFHYLISRIPSPPATRWSSNRRGVSRSGGSPIPTALM
jgi:hypothetical protein